MTTLNMNFGQALAALKAGRRVTRSGWNGKGMWLALQIPDAHSKMSRPYIYMYLPPGPGALNGALVPWVASQSCMLADDWVDINIADADADFRVETRITDLTAELDALLPAWPGGWDYPRAGELGCVFTSQLGMMTREEARGIAIALLRAAL